MVDYYRLRRMAIREIDEMISRKCKADKIKFHISSKYGLSEKIVDERIRQHLSVKKDRKKADKK